MLKGFRDFILRGNVVDLAVAVIIGAAFGAITSSVKVPSPLPANYIPPGEIHIGKALNAIIAFLLNAAAIYFMIVLPMQYLLKRFNPPAVAPPVTRACPQCLGDIPLAATRCKFCTQLV
jgi:large conductance mechanosensitive channel